MGTATSRRICSARSLPSGAPRSRTTEELLNHLGLPENVPLPAMSPADFIRVLAEDSAPVLNLASSPIKNVPDETVTRAAYENMQAEL